MNGPVTSPADEVLWQETTTSPGVTQASEERAGAPETAGGIHEPRTLELVELLLKDPACVDRLNRQPEAQWGLFPRLLLIAEASYLLFALVLLVVLNAAPPSAYPRLSWLTLPPTRWGDGTALGLPLAYMLGIVLAACVCLPSFYFYSLLAGAKLTWLQITSLLGKGLASNAIMLLGLLPAYVAVVLGLIVFEAPADWLRWALLLGLLLPFASGVWGLRAIYLGVMDLASALPPPWHCQRRCFLRRLVLSWTAVYAVVVPVMVYRLWEYFAGQVAIGL
jgi:hypothetical protein